MPARTAFHQGSESRRSRRGGTVPSHRRGPDVRASVTASDRAEPVPPTTEDAGAADDSEQFRVASRDRLIPRQRDTEQVPPRISLEVLLALAIVVVCMVGALAVGAAYTVQV